MKKYHTVVRRTFIKDGLLREEYIRVEDDYYEEASYYEKYYSESWSYPDTESAIVVNQFVTEDTEDDE